MNIKILCDLISLILWVFIAIISFKEKRKDCGIVSLIIAVVVMVVLIFNLNLI